MNKTSSRAPKESPKPSHFIMKMNLLNIISHPRFVEMSSPKYMDLSLGAKRHIQT